LGKGSNLHEVVIPFAGSFPNSSPPGQGGVSAENFTTQQCVFLRLRTSLCCLWLDTNLTEQSICCKYFNRIFVFLSVFNYSCE
jgi:hypothetical protein